MKTWIVMTTQPHPTQPRGGFRLAVVTADAAVLNESGDLAFYRDGSLHAGFAGGEWKSCEIADASGREGLGWAWHDGLPVA